MFSSDAFQSVHWAPVVLLKWNLVETSKHHQTWLTQQKKVRLSLWFTPKHWGVQPSMASHCKPFDSVPRHNVFSKTHRGEFSSELNPAHLNDQLQKRLLKCSVLQCPPQLSSSERLRVQKCSLDWVLKGRHCWCALTKTEFSIIFQNSGKRVSSCWFRITVICR